jgi:hypothetical protein
LALDGLPDWFAAFGTWVGALATAVTAIVAYSVATQLQPLVDESKRQAEEAQASLTDLRLQKLELDNEISTLRSDIEIERKKYNVLSERLDYSENKLNESTEKLKNLDIEIAKKTSSIAKLIVEIDKLIVKSTKSQLYGSFSYLDSSIRNLLKWICTDYYFSINQYEGKVLLTKLESANSDYIIRQINDSKIHPDPKKSMLDIAINSRVGRVPIYESDYYLQKVDEMKYNIFGDDDIRNYRLDNYVEESDNIVSLYLEKFPNVLEDGHIIKIIDNFHDEGKVNRWYDDVDVIINVAKEIDVFFSTESAGERSPLMNARLEALLKEMADMSSQRHRQ